MYASYYMCRYNFRFATPGMIEEYGFSKTQIADMLSAWSIAYGTGQLVNGLLTDRIGGKAAMLIGAIGTVAVNLVFGFASFVGTFSTFALIWLVNGWFQSFGAPRMVKIDLPAVAVDGVPPRLQIMFSTPIVLTGSDVRAQFGDEFARAWELYLAGSEAAFATGWMQLFQVLFAPRESAPPAWTRADLYADADVA